MKIPETLTKMGHALFGFASTLATLIHPVLPALSAALFLVYELDEEWCLSDEAYEEMREYLYGVAAALLLILARWFMVG
ncbi:MAG: hypothetical protein HA494_08195 [Thaumarchaeota archaeon]|jgi:hypothetical protein|nr:hypothetical protein [Nitrososphaerota archaeon]